MEQSRRRPKLLLVAAITILVITPAAASSHDEAEDIDCSRWSIKGLRLGMKLEAVKKEHEKLKHGRNWFRPDDEGRSWYFWAENRMKGIYNYVLPETDEPDGKLVSIMAILDTAGSSPSAVVDALIERWGPPEEHEVPINTVRYYNVFGAPGGEFVWKATTWEDSRCDVLATLLDKTKMPPTGGGGPFKEITVSLDSLEKLVERIERERERAREIVEP